MSFIQFRIADEEKIELHEKSIKYWSTVSNSYLASKEYYDLQHLELAKLLKKYGPFTSCLDLGCGSGRYTYLAAQFSDSVTGIDASQSLIDQAMNFDNTVLTHRPVFHQALLENSLPFGIHSLVMCLGVLSCVLSPVALNKILSFIACSVGNSGYLIVKDTLSKTDEFTSISGDYVAIYRKRTQYIQQFLDCGFELLSESMLVDLEKTTNSLMVFRRQ